MAEGGADSVEEGTTELDVPVTQAHFPSSFGMTFCVDGSANWLVVHAYWGQYNKEVREEQIDEKTGNPIRVWKRYSHGGMQEVPLTAGVIKPFMLDGRSPDVFVQGQIRKRDEHFFVTLFLVNGQEEVRGPERHGRAHTQLHSTFGSHEGDNNQPIDAPGFGKVGRIHGGDLGASA